MSGTHGSLRLMQLASSQLCDGIKGLVGALSHEATRDREKGALRALHAELRLRRAAWGPDGEALSREQIRVLAEGLPDRIKLDVSAVGSGIEIPAATGRLVLNLLLLSADSLPAGGLVVLAGTPDDLFLRISGPSAAWPAGLAQCLVDETEALSALADPRNLQMALTALLGHDLGIRLSMLISPTSQTEPAILRVGR